MHAADGPRRYAGIAAGLFLVAVACSKGAQSIIRNSGADVETSAPLVAAAAIEFALGVWLVVGAERRAPSAAAAAFLAATAAFLLALPTSAGGRGCGCFGPLYPWLGDRGSSALRGMLWVLVGVDLWGSFAPDRARKPGASARPGEFVGDGAPG